MKPHHVLGIALSLACTLAMRADHTPEWMMSSAAPETRLNGISISGGTIGSVKRRFGKPVCLGISMKIVFVFKDESELRAELSTEGKITSLELFASIE